MRLRETYLKRGLAVVAMMAACTLGAQPASSGTSDTQMGAGARALTTTDAEQFIKAAAQDNDAQIAMAQVAQRKSDNQQVKDLAQMIEGDHRNANQKLKPIAETHGISLDQSLSGKTEGQLNQLKEAGNEQFNQRYVKDMLRHHTKAIQKFEQASKDLDQSDVKNYAETCLPTLRKHLQHAENVARSLGLSQQEISSIEQNTPGGMGGTGEQQENQAGKSPDQ